MTTSDALDVFGSEIDVQYYNGSEYVDTTARYLATSTVSSCDWSDPSGYLVSGTPCLIYSFSASGLNRDPSYITVDLQPQYSLFDTEFFYSFIGTSCSYELNTSVYQSPQWEWYVNGSRMVFEGNTVVPESGVLPRLSTARNINQKYIFTPAYFSASSTFSAYSVRATFTGTGTYSGSVFIAIGCPYISSGAYGANGTITDTTPGSSGGDVNVTVDMSETNGLLGSLIDAVQGLASALLDGIKGLFVPSEDELTAFSKDMETLAQEHLGGLYQAWQLLEDFFDGLKNVSSKDSITIPACHVPLAGETLILGPYTVPLKVEGMPAVLYESIAFIVDFLVTAAFVNMCKRKLEIFLNPDSEVITDDS